jgi:hypothetical protein
MTKDEAKQFPLTCLEVVEVDLFRVREEASIPLAAEVEDLRGAAHIREAVEGNIPLAHICGHMDQDDSPAGTRAAGLRVHSGRSSHNGHDEGRDRSLAPQEEHPISEMVLAARQQGHSAQRWEARRPRARQRA